MSARIPSRTDPTSPSAAENPARSYPGWHSLTALQKHAAFFDSDHDARVRFGDTFRGLRQLGLNLPLAFAFSTVINVFLGYLTQRRFSMTISVLEIARGTHPFDSGVFDSRGELDVTAFDRLFGEMHTSAPRDRLTFQEMRRFILWRDDPDKPFGTIGSWLSRLFSYAEASVLFCLAADGTKTVGGAARPALSRRRLAAFYAGRLLPSLARLHRIRTEVSP